MKNAISKSRLVKIRLGDRLRVHRIPAIRKSRQSSGPLAPLKVEGQPYPGILRPSVIEGVVIDLHRFGPSARMVIRRTDVIRRADVIIYFNDRELVQIECLERRKLHRVHFKPIRSFAPLKGRSRQARARGQSHSIPAALISEIRATIPAAGRGYSIIQGLKKSDNQNQIEISK